MRVRHVVDDANAVIAITVDHAHQRLRVRQERERHVLDQKPCAGLARQRRQRVQRAIEMRDHAIARHRKQRIGLAGTDDDAAGPEFAGAANELYQQVERIGAHFLRRRADIHVDIGHIDRHQPQPRFAEIAQAAQRRGIQLRRPEMPGKEHQFDPAITLVGQPRHGVGGAAAEDIGVGVHANAGGYAGHELSRAVRRFNRAAPCAGPRYSRMCSAGPSVMPGPG